MAKEKIANLFLFVNGPHELIREIGVKWYDMEGTDEEKISFLQRCVLIMDWKESTKHRLPDWCGCVHGGMLESNCISHASFAELIGTESGHRLLEETIWSHYDFSPDEPLMVITPIVDGVVKIDLVTEIGA